MSRRRNFTTSVMGWDEMEFITHNELDIVCPTLVKLILLINADIKLAWGKGRKYSV